MIERVAVVPHPPLLVPELVVADDPDVRLVRDACLAVAAELAAAAPRWVARRRRPGRPRELGPDAAAPSSASASTSWRGCPRNDAEPDPAHAAARARRRLAARAGRRRPRSRSSSSPPDLPPADCRALGERLAAEPPTSRSGCWSSATARTGTASAPPGRPDPRAAAFDDAVHAALAAADPDALLALDPALAAELGAVGRAPWQVLAGAVAADGRRWKSADARQLVPFGVAYHVAVWEPVR